MKSPLIKSNDKRREIIIYLYEIVTAKYLIETVVEWWSTIWMALIFCLQKDFDNNMLSLQQFGTLWVSSKTTQTSVIVMVHTSERFLNKVELGSH